jgi:hypothetical protein
MLEKIRHENFLAFLECFSHEGFMYAVFEHEIKPGVHLPITLSHYALVRHYPTESQLATILGQVRPFGGSFVCSNEQGRSLTASNTSNH